MPRQTRSHVASRNARTGGNSFRKYGNIPTVVNGERFDSKKEAARFVELTLLQRAGAISDLKRGTRYEFYHNEVKIGSYKPDFIYTENGQQIIEDVKGGSATKTQAYMMRKKMMKAFFGIDVRES